MIEPRADLPARHVRRVQTSTRPSAARPDILPISMRVQVGIVGAGPAGLFLAELLARAGIESAIVESRSREYCEQRIRAGLLERHSVDLIRALGLGERMDREGMVHHGFNLRHRGGTHYFAYEPGVWMTIYGQQEVVKDFIAARLAAGTPIAFEAADVACTISKARGPRSGSGPVRKRARIECDYIAGCDGFHGICRPSDSRRRDALLRPRVSRSPGSAFSPRRRRSTRRARLYSSRSTGSRFSRCGRRPLAAATSQVPARRRHRRLAATTASGTSMQRRLGGRRPAHARRRPDRAEGHDRRCAASSPSRCSSAGCFSPATPRISSRRPAPRG